MAGVRAKEGESAEGLLRRYKRACEKAALLAEVRKRDAYEKPTTKRKRKRAAAIKRSQKKMLRANPMRSDHRKH